MDEVIRCKTAAENLIAGLLCPRSFSSMQCNNFFVENQTAELKNCSKKTPGFERCECPQDMDDSNADRVKVKEFDIFCETPSCEIGINIRINPQSFPLRYFFSALDRIF